MKVLLQYYYFKIDIPQYSRFSGEETIVVQPTRRPFKSALSLVLQTNKRLTDWSLLTDAIYRIPEKL
ncbi:MAG TPA: hypothetical protein VFJ51_12740 [Nitrososphaeraceae archaeon]|nr:hypothetical protein [Nitrososphaeraceae archaeon]